MRASAGRSIAKLIAFLSGICPGPLNAGRLVVEGEVPRAVRRAREELAVGPVDAVPLGELARTRLGTRRLARRSRSGPPRRRAGSPRAAPPIVHTIWSTFAGPAAAVVRVAFQHDPLVGDPLGDVVGARAGGVVDPLRVDRRVREDRAEERQRQPRGEIPDSASSAGSAAGSGRARGRRRSTRPCPSITASAPTISRMKAFAGERKPRVGVAVERVGEALCGHRAPVWKRNVSLQLEGVGAPVSGDRERPNDLRDDARAGRARRRPGT